MKNNEVAQKFDDIADLLEIKGEKIYRILAYRRGAQAIRELGRDLTQIHEQGELESIPGVGKAISAKIEELLTHGSLEFYDRLAAEIPPSLIQVLKVSDVGPKKAARFWKELGITTIAELEQAAKEGRLQGLSGMGAKSEARILEGVEAMKRQQSNRYSIGDVRPVAQLLQQALRAVQGVERVELGGSLRRWRETIGDIDIMVASDDPGPVMEAFLGMEQVRRVRGQGETKSSVELVNGMLAQVWVHSPARFGAAWQYTTGSQAHNVRLRELAQKQGLSLSDQGFKTSSGKEILCRQEEQVYQQLGLDWVPPELREDRGEIKAAQEHGLPDLLKGEDISSDLHTHSDWSDGALSIEAMGRAALESGLKVLAISDHSRSLGIANGLSIERLREQRKAIDLAQIELGDSIRLLQGAEVEILANGQLDYPDEVLATLDIVIASLHTSLRQPRATINERLLSAIRNPHVDIIGHPTGRLIGKREAADLDMEAIFQAAVEHDVVLEINANPERLDLNEAHARRAVELGCRLALNTDAHHADHFNLRMYGVGIARRAWVEARHVINCWSEGQLLDWLKARS